MVNISFLVPIYNHEPFIICCLNSLVKCTKTISCEIIIIDDGSKDNGFELVKNWLIKYEKFFEKVFFYRRENRGITKTLNEMLAKSSGRFIVPIASDDYIVFDGFIARFNFAMSRPDLDAVLGDAIVVDEIGSQLCASTFFDFHSANKTALLLGGDFLVTELIYRWSVAGPCGLIRRAVYSEIGVYDESLRVEDREFYLRLLARGKVAFYDGVVAAYRVHSQNFSLVSANRTGVNSEIMATNAKAVFRFKGTNALFLWTYKSYFIGNSFLNMLARYPSAGLRFLLRKVFNVRVAKSNI